MIKRRVFKSSTLVTTVVILASLALSIYNYIRIDKVKLQVASKQSEANKDYQILEEKLRSSSDYIKDFNQKITNLEQKFNDSDKNIRELQVGIAQVEMLDNADKLMAMQFKHIIGMASEQLKITQDPMSAINTLQEIDDRLKDFPSSHWSKFRNALNQDVLNLKLQPSSDNSNLLDRINKSIIILDKIQFIDLPNNIKLEQSNDNIWFKKLYKNIWIELSSLVQIRKINNPDSISLSKNEQWFIKENIKLLLTQAKLAIYNKNQIEFNNYMSQIRYYSDKFIDNNSKLAMEFNKYINDLNLVKFANNLNINKTVQAVNDLSK